MALTAPVALSAPASTTFKPVADTYSRSDLPSTSFGTLRTLRVDGSPISRSYLRFNVQLPASPPTQVQKATLRVFSNSSASSSGADLRSVASTSWGEGTLNYGNAPPVGTSIVSHVGAFQSAQWISFDATQLVRGSGLVSMALTTTSSTSRGFQAREDTVSSPQLVVETGDVTPPAVTLTVPPDGSWTTNATPTFGGGAGTVADDSATVRVRIYSGTSVFGIPIQTLTTTRSGAAWSVPASPALADGTYTAQAEQSDAAANTGASAPHTFTVDRIAPAVGMTTPSDGAWTTDTTPTLSGAAGTTAGDSSTVTVRVYGGSSASGTPLQTLAANVSGGAWSVDASSALPEGTYTAQPEQLDQAGNRGVGSARTFTIDTTAPAVSLTDPAGGSTIGDATPAFGGGAGSAPGDSSTVTVKVYAGSSASGTPGQTITTVRSSDLWSVESTSSLADGAYTVTAEQSDSAGNAAVSTAHTFTVAGGAIEPPPLVDTTPPVVSLTTPVQGSSGNDPTPTFAGAAGTATGDSSTVTVNVYSGSGASGTPVATLLATAAGGSWTMDASPALPEGAYTAQAEQVDQAGNRGLSAASTFTIDTTAPAVSLTAPADASSTDDKTPTFTGGAGVATGDSSTVTVNIYSGSSASGTPVETLTAILAGGGWAVDASPPLSNGVFTVRAEQLDQAGNQGLSSASTFTIAGDPVLMAAGDIACDPTSGSFNGGLGTSTSCRQMHTSNLLLDEPGAEVLALGDNQYEDGALANYQQAFDLSWGRAKSRIHPAPGNHDYGTPEASGYFDYFNGVGNSTGPAGDRTKGYYSFGLGSWHIVALNSNCSNVGGCGAGSPQELWLRSDLAAHPSSCTLAYWHHPLFSSGSTHGNNPSMAAIWQALYDARADVVLSGHDHLYERFAPQTVAGAADPARGIREFVVGTGGRSLFAFKTPEPNSAVRDGDTFGVLKMTLHADGYDWRFVPEAGKTFTDSGAAVCDSSSNDATPPSTPSGLTATHTGGAVELAWTASTDNEGVAGYRIFRDGTQIATSTVARYSDSSVQPNTSYSYHVVAYDAAGNASPASNTAAVTTAAVAQVVTFGPTDDSSVYSGSAGTNYGSGTSLEVDNSPVKNFLLRFGVSGLGAKRVISAKLRLYCIDPSPIGGDFRRVANTTWGEQNITWTNAPPADATVLGSLGKVSSGSWYEVDVTPLVTGDGPVSLRVTSTAGDGADYSSKEGTAGLAPQLVVTLG